MINSETKQRLSSVHLSRVLGKLMLEHNVDGVQLSKHTGIPTTTINRLRNADPNTNPTLLTLLPLAQFFSITLSQLIGEEPLSDIETNKKITRLPILSWEEALIWPRVTEQTTSSIVTDHNYSKNAFALIATEDYSEKIEKGTILLIDPLATPLHFDYVLTFKQEQEFPSLKQFIIEDGMQYLRSLYSKSIVTPFTSEFKILGVIIEYKKNCRSNKS